VEQVTEICVVEMLAVRHQHSCHQQSPCVSKEGRQVRSSLVPSPGLLSLCYYPKESLHLRSKFKKPHVFVPPGLQNQSTFQELQNLTMGEIQPLLACKREP
jgi:hypothetical protein